MDNSHNVNDNVDNVNVDNFNDHQDLCRKGKNFTSAPTDSEMTNHGVDPNVEAGIQGDPNGSDPNGADPNGADPNGADSTGADSTVVAK